MRILFIDDDEHIQTAVGEHLKVIYKVDVVAVYDGQEALDLLAKDTQFDCMVLDARMPNVDGREFLQRYKGNIPIIYSSAYGGETPASVAAVVPKPYGARELLDEIRRVTGKE